MFWDAKILVYFACAVYFYGILLFWRLWSIWFIFRCYLKKHLFASEKQNKKTKWKANKNTMN